MLDFSQFRCLTFDCYGTMMDWESGILAALQPIMRRHGKQVTDSQLLSMYADLESQAERGSYQPYRDVLRSVVAGIARKLGFTPTFDEIDSLPNSVDSWQPFPDTVAALRRLKTRYQLGVISNVDDDLFAATARVLEVPFDFVITAQQARSYKPSPNNFQLAFSTIGLPRDQILHVAQSLHHDHVPARQLGLKSVWVNRPRRVVGASAVPPAEANPDLTVGDLRSLANMAVPEAATAK